MKIFRDNVAIELSKEEIHMAYRQHLYDMDKELIKGRLMEFIFDDEYKRIEDKEAFYNEVTVEFRKNLSNCDSDLEDALGSAIFSRLFKYIESNEKTEIKEDIKNATPIS